MITNSQFGTRIDEINDGIYRIFTPIPILGGFNFNQYLVVDDEPLLFHTGPRRLFPLVQEAVSNVIPANILKRTSVDRSTSGWRPRPLRLRSPGPSARWFRSTILRTAKRGAWQTEKSCRLAGTG